MQIKADSPGQYLERIPDDRKVAFGKLRAVIIENLPKEFVETMSYGMITYVIPHSIYPNGYHVDPKQQLPFLSIASQKNFIVLYHLGIYADKKLLDWFTGEYPKHSKTKPDMGKSCIRFKKPEHIPYSLIGELCTKISSQEFIQVYEKNIGR